MAKSFQLDVVTPERLVVSEQIESVVAPGAEGEFGVLAGHIPFLSTLLPGELRYNQGGQVHFMAVTGGFAEVGPEKVTVLADTAELAREIDIDRAQKARERAEQRLKEAKLAAEEYARLQASLQRALARIRVANKNRGV